MESDPIIIAPQLEPSPEKRNTTFQLLVSFFSWERHMCSFSWDFNMGFDSFIHRLFDCFFVAHREALLETKIGQYS